MSQTLTLRHFVLLATGLAVITLVAVDAGPLIRAPLALALLLVGPGLAWTWIFGIESPEMEGALAVALSLGAEILAGLVLLGVGLWSPNRLLVVVIVLVVAGVATELRLARPSTAGAV